MTKAIAIAAIAVFFQILAASQVGASAALAALDGNWYSKEWRYGYVIKDGVGKATSTNSPNFQVGQDILFLEPSGAGTFKGRQVYTDGKFYAVTAVLQANGELQFSGERNARWVMRRLSGPDERPADATNKSPIASAASPATAAQTTSLLQTVMGKRWSIGEMPCTLNGGAYDTFTRDRGVVFTAGGKEQTGQARSRFEYLDQGAERFTYTQQFLANDMVGRQLGDPNAVSAAIETVYSRVSPNKISFTKKITQLNFDALMKGEKKYDRTTESGHKLLCAN